MLRSKRTNSNDGTPLLDRSVPSSGSGGGLVGGIITGLTILAIAGIVLTITFGVLYGNETKARQPKYSGRTVPQAVNDAMYEYIYSNECGDSIDPTSTFPNYLARLGDPNAQVGCNLTTLVDPHWNKNKLSLSSSVNAIKRRLGQKIAPYLGTGAMTRAQEEFLRVYTERAPTDLYLNYPPGGTPAKCQGYYRALNTLGAGAKLFGGFLQDTNTQWFGPNDIPNLYPGTVTNIDTPSIGIYNSTSVQTLVEALQTTRNRYRDYLAVDYATAMNDDFIELTGLSRPALQWADDIAAETIGVAMYWNDTNFAGGSSLLYDAILVRFAEWNYSPTSGERLALQNAISAVKVEATAYLGYLVAIVPTFPVVTVPAASYSGEEYNTRYAKMLPNNLWADCGRAQIEGVYTHNATAAFLASQTEVLSARAIAEPILTAQIPDYLGWPLTYVHLYYGTEAGVTDLGYFGPADCAPYDASARAYKNGGITQLQARSRLGELANTFSKHPIRPHFWLTDSRTECEYAPTVNFADSKIAPHGDYEHRGFGYALIQPSVPMSQAEMVQHMIVEMDSQEQALSTYQCAHCHYYRSVGSTSTRSLLSDLFIGQSVIGRAIYMTSREFLQDLGGVVGSGSLDEAFFALLNLQQANVAGAFYGIQTGQTTALDWATFTEANDWLPFGSIPDATDFYSVVGERPVTNIYCGQSGRDRLLVMRKKINAQCPGVVGAGKRVLDAMMALPQMPITAIEIAIDEYVASGCTNWLYEESPYLRQ